MTKRQVYLLKKEDELELCCHKFDYIAKELALSQAQKYSRLGYQVFIRKISMKEAIALVGTEKFINFVEISERRVSGLLTAGKKNTDYEDDDNLALQADRYCQARSART